MTIDLRTCSEWDVKIELNRSKSLYIRYLIYYYLQHGEVLPVPEGESHDIHIVARSLQMVKEAACHDKPIIIDVEDCGAAYRFLLALLSVTEGEWRLTGSPRLLQRPIAPLINALQGIGAEILQTDRGIIILGKTLSAKEVTIDCSLSSQFASAILLIGSTIGLHKLVILPDTPPSLPYIEMTFAIIQDELLDNFNPADIERDWSSAAFWYAMTALSRNGRCEMEGLYLDSLQGDSIVADWFVHFGVISKPTEKGIVITKDSSFTPDNKILIFDISATPDLSPILSVLAILSGQPILLKGCDNLNHKESRRLDIIACELSSFAEISLHDEGRYCLIMPSEKMMDRELSFKSYEDHRFVMAFMLFALSNKIKIDNCTPVKKSYPRFLEDVMHIQRLSLP